MDNTPMKLDHENEELKAAQERGLTVEQYRLVVQLEYENAKLKAATYNAARKKLEFSALQNTLLFVIFVVFIIATHRILSMLNLSNGLVVLCAFGTIFFASLVFLFAGYLGQFKFINSPWLAVLITAVIFLRIPVTASITINAAYPVCERQYLQSIPSDNKISVKITYDIEFVDGKGNVGNEWRFQYFLKSIRTTELQNGAIVTVDMYAPFSIISRFTERDSIDDVGETVSQKYKYSENENYKRTLTISQYVHIEENGGRKNAGAFVDYKVNYVLERVLPDSVGFWDIISINDVERMRCVHWMWGECFCIIAILFTLLRGNNLQKEQRIAEEKLAQLESEKHRIEVEQQKQLKAEKLRMEAEQWRIAEEKRRAEIKYQNQLRAEQQRIAEEKRRAEHDDLVAKYSNKTRTQIAIECGMPSELYMDEKDLPHDIPENGTRDRCTVYIARKGSVYHCNPRCHQASLIPTHILRVRHLKPCRHCNPRYIPLDWYKTYKDTIELMHKHGMEPIPDTDPEQAR